VKRSMTDSARMGFLRHRKSIKSIRVWRNLVEGEINLALTHRLDEFQLAIPWRVAPQQSPSPLHQLEELCNSESVGSNDPAKPKTVRLDFYVRQRIIVRLDFYVRQHDLMRALIDEVGAAASHPILPCYYYDMSSQKELAYRYDIFITSDWRERFDALISEKVELPVEGRILEVNCGTGSFAIEMAERIKGKGEVIALDPSKERIELARAKAEFKKIARLTFECAPSPNLPFGENEFDAVIGDASTIANSEIEGLLSEMVRVAKPGSRVVLKMTTRGSFDEFFSIYWEALLDCGLIDEVWEALELLIKERCTLSQAEQMASRAGLKRIESFCRKEEFLYDTGKDFIESPLIKDTFLPGWLSIVPKRQRKRLSRRIVSIIERERHGAPFDLSIKATLISGVK
jgi:ubiquinone/menaquinone biosynthesis C-methylase UbiE